MPPLTLSTKALSDRSGLAVRQVQTFTDAGVLIPDEGTEAPGRGGTRQYPRSEEEVAKLIGAICHRGMPVAEARGIATTLRRIVRAPDDLGFKGLEQARKLRSYLNSWLAMPGLPHGSIPDPHRFMHYSGIIAELQPRWGHVEPTEDTLKTIQAWIILELAKRGEADPIMFLYRDADETWLYEFWAILPRVQASTTLDEKAAYNVEFDHILIELSREESGSPMKRRGGYVIMPRSIYRNSISTA